MVRVFKKPTLIKFWKSRKDDAQQAERDLTAWYNIARKAGWKDFGALKQPFGSADVVGSCVVFDVGNNRYRLIGRIKYGTINHRVGMLFVLKVMDHQEYDKKLWIEQCGCRSHPPAPKVKPKKTADQQAEPKPKRATPEGREKKR
jgi:mRNA interferase HigB